MSTWSDKPALDIPTGLDLWSDHIRCNNIDIQENIAIDGDVQIDGNLTVDGTINGVDMPTGFTLRSVNPISAGSSIIVQDVGPNFTLKKIYSSTGDFDIDNTDPNYININIASSGVIADNYPDILDGTRIPRFTVDASGRLTFADSINVAAGGGTLQSAYDDGNGDIDLSAINKPLLLNLYDGTGTVEGLHIQSETIGAGIQPPPYNISHIFNNTSSTGNNPMTNIILGDDKLNYIQDYPNLIFLSGMGDVATVTDLNIGSSNIINYDTNFSNITSPLSNQWLYHNVIGTGNLFKGYQTYKQEHVIYGNTNYLGVPEAEILAGSNNQHNIVGPKIFGSSNELYYYGHIVGQSNSHYSLTDASLGPYSPPNIFGFANVDSSSSPYTTNNKIDGLNVIGNSNEYLNVDANSDMSNINIIGTANYLENNTTSTVSNINILGANNDITDAGLSQSVSSNIIGANNTMAGSQYSNILGYNNELADGSTNSCILGVGIKPTDPVLNSFIFSGGGSSVDFIANDDDYIMDSKRIKFGPYVSHENSTDISSTNGTMVVLDSVKQNITGMAGPAQLVYSYDLKHATREAMITGDITMRVPGAATNNYTRFHFTTNCNESGGTLSVEDFTITAIVDTAGFGANFSAGITGGSIFRINYDATALASSVYVIGKVEIIVYQKS